MKIHILGASGSGTSTVGRILSERMAIPLFESDDMFWEKTEIPFSVKRAKGERVELLNRIIENNQSWVIAGSALKWGDILLETADCIVLLTCPKEERRSRLMAREKARFADRIEAGNDMHSNHKEFIEWAMSYDTGGLDTRSRASEEAWIERAKGRTVRIENLNSERTANLLINDILFQQNDLSMIRPA
jgi:adenylate kinase family enzyme